MNERRVRCWLLMRDRLGVAAVPCARFDVDLPSGGRAIVHLMVWENV